MEIFWRDHAKSFIFSANIEASPEFARFAARDGKLSGKSEIQFATGIKNDDWRQFRHDIDDLGLGSLARLHLR